MPTFEKQTHCQRGHRLIGRNIYIDPKGRRTCIVCKQHMARRWYLKKKSEHKLTAREKKSHCEKSKAAYRKNITDSLNEDLAGARLALCELNGLILAKTRGIKHEAFGQRKTLREWAREYGIKYESLLARRNKGEALESALVRRTNYNKLHRAFGKVQTLKEWASEYGMDYRRLWTRIRRDNWAIEKALITEKRAW